MIDRNKPTIVLALPWELYNKGGVNTVVKGLIGQLMLNDSPYNVILHINNWQKHTADDYAKGYKVLRIPTTDLSCCDSFSNKIKCLLLHLPLMYLKWFWAIKKYNIQAINVHFPTANSLGLITICKLSRVKSIFSFHGADITQFHHAVHANKIQRFAHQVDNLVVSSLFVKQRLVKINSAYSAKLAVIPNGIDTHAVAATTKVSTHNVSRDNLASPPYLINIATFENKKGQDLIIRAFHLLCKNNQHKDLQLLLVGRKTEYLQTLKALTLELEITDRVIFHTDLKHRQAMALLSKAQAFLLPSRDEPFGVVLLEAGVLNIPVIAHSTGGVKEIIQSDYNGILLLENTVQQWSQTLNNFFLDKYDTNTFVKNFATTIEKNYTNNTVLAAYLKLLQY
ncbi:glycosyltransferase family 4 protein [Paraglaciecola aquimarina]|uniref:Glycosyltransferase family 4 protein n=1 Tax=Paraglaciecola aquimarina TaxID=1235557 RepID=A0ABU3SZ00_9ALTE|nr:glycosyltransferase family 4 protein [Paraglaciecola aquimarina]MDU0355233.1 glycosyltransferase family 4 protein [Paraglaciecola aquimarina]